MANRIKDLNKDCAGNWSAENVRKTCADNFDAWYNMSVKDKTRREFDTYFHKSAKRSAKYECRKGILDMTDGPIVSEEQWKLLQENETNIETIMPATSEKDIRNLQKLYQRKQFGHDRGLIYRSGDRIRVTHDEVLDTIRKLGKKQKASSWDNVKDTIFSRRAFKRLRFNGTSFQDYIQSDTEDKWHTLIENKLATTLQRYFNHLLEENKPLPAKQNLIRQIYLPKSEDQLRRFENCRPISITSPIYKVIDSILNARLTSQLNEDGFQLNPAQTGFRSQIGCEVNILRLIETIR